AAATSRSTPPRRRTFHPADQIFPTAPEVRFQRPFRRDRRFAILPSRRPISARANAHETALPNALALPPSRPPPPVTLHGLASASTCFAPRLHIFVGLRLNITPVST